MIVVKFGIHNEVLSRYGIIELRLVGYVDRHKISTNLNYNSHYFCHFVDCNFHPYTIY